MKKSPSATVRSAAGPAAAAVVVGAAIALAGAIALLPAAPAVRARVPVAAVAPVDVVRLEPIVVTISASRYAAIRAEAAGPVIGYEPVEPVVPVPPVRRHKAAA